MKFLYFFCASFILVECAINRNQLTPDANYEDESAFKSSEFLKRYLSSKLTFADTYEESKENVDEESGEMDWNDGQHNDGSHSREENKLIDGILHGIGISKAPDVRKINISENELKEKYLLYLKSIQSAEIVNKFQGHYEGVKHHLMSFNSIIEPDDDYENVRDRRSISDEPLDENGIVLKYPLNFTTKNSLITSSKIILYLHNSEGNQKKRVNFEIHQLLEPVTRKNASRAAKLFVDKLSIDVNRPINLIVSELNVKRAVTWWLMHPEQNHGLYLTVSESSVLHDRRPALVIGVSEAAASSELENANQRDKRSAQWERVGLDSLDSNSFFDSTLEEMNDSPDPDDCQFRHGKRCCRKSMRVDFDALGSTFNFIISPRHFNSYVCQGKCPARFNPASDHSLIQSLMHIRSKERLDHHDKVPKPCCVPGQLKSLQILHVDEHDLTKLKVTHWKDVIASHCACA